MANQLNAGFRRPANKPGIRRRFGLPPRRRRAGHCDGATDTLTSRSLSSSAQRRLTASSAGRHRAPPLLEGERPDPPRKTQIKLTKRAKQRQQHAGNNSTHAQPCAQRKRKGQGLHRPTGGADQRESTRTREQSSTLRPRKAPFRFRVLDRVPAAVYQPPMTKTSSPPLSTSSAAASPAPKLLGRSPRRGVPVILHEMRGVRGTDAHKTDGLAELVCSNSFRSDDATSNAVGVIHAEMRLAGSLIMACGRSSIRCRPAARWPSTATASPMPSPTQSTTIR